jgi:transcriptional regulator with XRE-family HTH domain
MATRLRVTRVLLGWSQEEAANKLATSLRTYSGWETGERPIPYRTYQWLTERLAELVHLEESRQREQRKRFESRYNREHPLPAE